MDSELKAVLREAFGDSSSDSGGEQSSENQLEGDETSSIARSSPADYGQTWQPVAGINGLWICRDFLSLRQQLSLLSSLEKEGYFAGGSHNQAMRFGDLPSWAIELSLNIRDNLSLCGSIPVSVDHSSSDENCGGKEENCLLPPDLLWREPLFNQLIVNIYQPGEGICAHVDLMRFEDGIAIVSLESSCVMHFSPVEAEEANDHIEELDEQEQASSSKLIPVLLTPGSLILMWGEARYLWKHQINRKPGCQQWEGEDIDQKRRTSITLRRLCQTD